MINLEKDIDKVEEQVNIYAKKVAKEHNVPEDAFRITLVKEGRGIMHMIRGPVVQIRMEYPACMFSMNSLLREAFGVYHRYKMRDYMALESYAVIRQRQTSIRKFYKESFGDESEIIPDMLPRSEISFKTEIARTVVAKHRRLGIMVEVVDITGERDINDLQDEARVKLSRIVRQFNEDIYTKETGRRSEERSIPSERIQERSRNLQSTTTDRGINEGNPSTVTVAHYWRQDEMRMLSNVVRNSMLPEN